MKDGARLQVRTVAPSAKPMGFPRSLRRTTAAYLHEAGVPQSLAMTLFGHDSAYIHSIYVNVGEEVMRSAAQKLLAL